MTATSFLGVLLPIFLLTAAAVAPAAGQTTPPTPEQQVLRTIYRELVEINTTASSGNCTEAAEAMGRHLVRAGLSESDIQVLVPSGAGQKGNLVARYRGTGGKKPILLLAHLDVVEAKRADWERDPFQLVEENGYFYARGAFDDKAMAAILVANLVRYRAEGYRPERDLVLALTCDEEVVSLTNGVEYLLKHHRALIDAELALNEGATGLLDKGGNYVRLGLQAGEKVVLQYQLEVTNPGGHSSLPQTENAIYRLAEALVRIGKFEFPVNLSDTTRGYFARMASIESGQVADDMRAAIRTPPDPDAIARLSRDPFNNATLRTTCVATMIQGGHAINALPQRAQAQVNCRVLPNDSLAEVERQLFGVVADDQIKITRGFEPTVSPIPPLNPELLRIVEQVTTELWPGVPVVPTLFVAATDGRYLNKAGIPTYGVTGLFRDPDGSGVHGLNERIRIRSLYEGHEFLYRVVKRLGSN
jgi:acetylornithine deacetylase/succinyl-diaminopimelate desuccinylase-like protein